MAKDTKPKRDYSAMAHISPDHPVKDESASFEFDGFAKTLAKLALRDSVVGCSGFHARTGIHPA